MGCCGVKLKLERIDEECYQKNKDFINECCKDEQEIKITEEKRESSKGVIIGVVLIVVMFMVGIAIW